MGCRHVFVYIRMIVECLYIHVSESPSYAIGGELRIDG
jgi:hypothetical protein